MMVRMYLAPGEKHLDQEMLRNLITAYIGSQGGKDSAASDSNHGNGNYYRLSFFNNFYIFYIQQDQGYIYIYIYIHIGL